MPPYKTCAYPHCEQANQPQPSNHFGRNKSTRDGLSAYCRSCAALKQREWKAAHQEKVRQWKQRYLQKCKTKAKEVVA